MEHNVTSMSELSAYFKYKAEQFYRPHTPEESWVPRRIPMPDEFKTLIDYWDVITAPTAFFEEHEDGDQLQSLTAEELQGVADILSHQGFSNFSHVLDGGSAKCFRTGHVALRVGPVPKGDKIDQNLVRAFCPLVVQPETQILCKNSHVLFEVMPFIPKLDDDEIPDLFGGIMQEILDGTCFILYDHDKDLGLLPDGTPIYLDPDGVSLENPYVTPTQEDFDQVRENALRMGWPEDLVWTLLDGSFKQHKFYPKPATARNFII